MKTLISSALTIERNVGRHFNKRVSCYTSCWCDATNHGLLYHKFIQISALESLQIKGAASGRTNAACPRFRKGVWHAWGVAAWNASRANKSTVTCGEYAIFSPKLWRDANDIAFFQIQSAANGFQQ